MIKLEDLTDDEKNNTITLQFKGFEKVINYVSS